MLRVVYADRWLIAVDKPAGLPAVPGRKLHERDCLATRIVEQFPTARIVHRLDRDTSGVMLLALDADTHRQLSAQFAQHTVLKRYVAVAYGRLEEDGGQIDLPLARWWAASPRHRVDYTFGKPALTRYEVLRRNPGHTRMALYPQTGRSHQLRVHLAAIGHPIVGDPLYAAAHRASSSDAGYAEMVGTNDSAPVSRLMLHAERLTVLHPTTGAAVTVSADCPF
jgi:tRNA pseudouridine32 synthase/23S rRNA pseudouridine746 synthase